MQTNGGFQGNLYSQADAVLVDDCGRRHPVHSGLLRLLFPVFRSLNIEEIRVVVLDQVSTPEAELLLELAYGMGRLAKISNSLSTSVLDSAPTSPQCLFSGPSQRITCF